jgi:hypothetical protein
MIEFTGAALTIFAAMFGIMGLVGLMACASITNGYSTPLFRNSVWMIVIGIGLALPLLVF